MITSEYLDIAKKQAHISSDNELARMLKWSKSQVNNYRHNRQAMDNEAARKIAEFVEIPLWKVIADMEVYRAKKSNNKVALKAWDKLSKQAGVTSLKALISLPLIVLSATYYILCKIALFNQEGMVSA